MKKIILSIGLIFIMLSAFSQLSITKKKVTLDSINARINNVYINDPLIVQDTLLKDLIVRHSAATAAAAGNENEIQFNNGGVMGASSGLKWNDTTLTMQGLNNNIFIGSGVGRVISSGSGSVFLGHNSGYNNTSGGSNVFIGFESGYSNTNASQNTFVGLHSGRSNTSGIQNTFIGYYSGKSNITGAGNVFLGYSAGQNETGSNKFILGNSTTSELIYGEFDNDMIRFNGKVELKPITAPTHNEGTIFYDDDRKAVVNYNDLADFSHELGYEHVARYYNNTGSTINEGTLLTPIGNKINGVIVPTVRLAGNSSIDSIQMVAISTTTTLTGQYGVVTLMGPVNNLDLSAFLTNDLVYVGKAGKKTNTSPEPPDYSLLVGKVFYADNDSGQIYMMPGKVEFDPAPHISSDTSRWDYVLDVTQNVFERVPIGNFDLEDNFGFTLVGDSIRCDVSGHVTIAVNVSYIGNAQADVWRKGIFLNNVEQHTVSRSTTSTSVGNSTVIKTMDVLKNDWLTFKFTNESADRDPTLNDFAYEIIFLHE